MGYIRNYFKPEDESILYDFYEQMNVDCSFNSSSVAWEWLRNAPCAEIFQLDKSAIWLENNKAAAVLQLLCPWPGYVKVDNRSDSEDLLLDIIRYGEAEFSGAEDERKYLVFCVSEKGHSLKKALIKQDYKLLPNQDNMLHYLLNKDISGSDLPEGFEVKILSEVYDFDRLSKLIWEGFDYQGPVPKIDEEVYPPIKHAWLKYNRDICSVVIAPDGSYASFCGLWYESKTQTGYLEPMVTVKEYRNQGFGKAVVYNSLEILKSYGCQKVFVDPDEESYHYYCNIGFERTNYSQYFNKIFAE